MAEIEQIPALSAWGKPVGVEELELRFGESELRNVARLVSWQAGHNWRWPSVGAGYPEAVYVQFKLDLH